MKVFWYLFLLFTVIACYKPLPEPKNSKLPVISIIGANNFGCFANDLVWKNDGKRRGPYNSTIKNEIFAVFYLYQKKDNAVLNINGQMTYENTDQTLSLIIKNKDLLNTGRFNVTELTFTDLITNKRYYLIDSISPPIINILRLDTTNKVASGTFEGTIFTQNKADKMVLRNGRFDVIIKNL